MGTVDFWVPVNRHRREPGGPHDTDHFIIQGIQLVGLVLLARGEPRNRRPHMLREREQKWYARRFGHYSEIPTLPSSRIGCAT